MPANSAECQQPEAWPASSYGHLREGYLGIKYVKMTLHEKKMKCRLHSVPTLRFIPNLVGGREGSGEVRMVSQV